jgi:hypothetical protein
MHYLENITMDKKCYEIHISTAPNKNITTTKSQCSGNRFEKFESKISFVDLSRGFKQFYQRK